MMQVVHIISGMKLGGAEQALVKLVSGDNKALNQHRLAVLDPTGAMHAQFAQAGFECIMVLNLKKHLIRDIIRLIFWLKRCKPDIVHTWLYHADLIGGLAARLTGCKRVVWGLRNSDIIFGGGISLSAFISMKICAILSRSVPVKIFSVSECGKIFHIKQGYDKSKVIVIPNGFDVEKFSFSTEFRNKIRSEYKIPKDRIVVASFGRYNEYKDHATFFEVAKKLISTDHKFLFLMVGRDVNSSNKVLMRAIDNTGYADHFLLLGESDRINELLCSVDIFCCHSKSEGFPNALGEAMSVGCLCVATDVGDTSILIGGGGILVPPSDTLALYEGVLRLAEMSAEEANKLRKAARRRIVEYFPNSLIVNRYGTAYDEVMNV